MRVIIKMSAVCAMLAIAVSCTTESVDVAVSNENSVLTIGLDSERTSLGEPIDGVRKVYWTAGDCIAANGVVSSEAEIHATSANIAEFEFAEVLTYPCNVLYPASLYKDVGMIEFPAVQNAAVDSFATNTLPMATCIKGADEAIKLHHLMGVIQLQIKASSGDDGKAPDMHPLFKVEFVGNAGEPLNGIFSIDYNTMELTPVEGKTKNESIVSTLRESLSATAITNIYIVVPAREYSAGFSIRIMDHHGHYMDVKKQSGLQIKRGEVVVMPVIEFKPHGTAFDIGLDNKK